MKKAPIINPMRHNKLRTLLDAEKPTLGTRLQSVWPSMVEVIGHTGLFDYVEFLAEYAPFSLNDLDNFCRAAELYDLGTMMKIDAEPRQFLAQRAIGAGFESILFADCRGVDDARQCVRIVRPETPEDGGINGAATRRIAFMGEVGSEAYVQALRDVVLVLMIEKTPAVEQIEAILETREIDMVQWGGADYSMSAGVPGQRQSPAIIAVERRVIEICQRAGVPARAEINTPDEAKYYLDLGVRHFSLSSDMNILYKWLRENGEALRKQLA